MVDVEGSTLICPISGGGKGVYFLVVYGRDLASIGIVVCLTAKSLRFNTCVLLMGSSFVGDLSYSRTDSGVNFRLHIILKVGKVYW